MTVIAVAAASAPFILAREESEARPKAYSHVARRLLLAAALPIFVIAALLSAAPATAYQPPLFSTRPWTGTTTLTSTDRVSTSGPPKMSATLTRRSSPSPAGGRPSSSSKRSGWLQCCEDGSCGPLSFVPTQFLGGGGGPADRQRSGSGRMGALFSSVSADEADADGPAASMGVPGGSDDEYESDATAAASSPVTSSKKVRLLRMPKVDGPSRPTSLASSSSSASFEDSATADVLVGWKENLYKISTYASMLCVVDCTLLPVITVLLPLFGIVASPAQAAWLHELGHRVALWFVLPVGGLAATMNYLSLRNPILSSMAALGLSLIYAANGGHHSPILSRLPHDLAHALHCGTVLHRTVNVVGCSLLLGSNYLSHRLGGCNDCGPDGRCRR